MKRVLITGASGQLGKALHNYLQNNRQYEIFLTGFSNSEGNMARLDLADEAAVDAYIDELKPDIIINCAAMTAVDLCESEQEKAFRINALGPKYLAQAAAKSGAKLVHISTDYVFDGRLDRPYTEEDIPNPINVYGKSKLVECSKRAGISYTHISEIERGNVCPSLKTLEKLAKALEKPVSYFLKGDSPVSLGERVRKLREAQGLTQVKLAAQLGISDSLIAQIETGKVQPSLNTLEKLADTLGVSVDYFLANPQEINSDAPNIVPIEQWVNLKKNRNRIEMFKEAEEWQQELALNIMELINKSLPGRMEVPADPITLEIASLLKELPVEKKKSVLDYIKFIASKEEVQANY